MSYLSIEIQDLELEVEALLELVFTATCEDEYNERGIELSNTMRYLEHVRILNAKEKGQ